MFGYIRKPLSDMAVNRFARIQSEVGEYFRIRLINVAGSIILIESRIICNKTCMKEHGFQKFKAFVNDELISFDLSIK
ncbi:hypothetical protein BLA29_004445 [Euroglyphus maynei]|uniref:Uncharacterized protein n=1 Tax=Euroglyphus maynei TaxID=6958 RepID=A0A1Y3B1Q0_EURMA|nr:hypothetical protein BLA29_004445 [Euroglyphus maynei]